MRIQILSAGAAAACLSIGAAFAGEMTDRCVERLAADGRDTSGCSCLEDRVVAGGLEDEFTALGEIADPAARYAAAADAGKAAMDACTRK